MFKKNDATRRPEGLPLPDMRVKNPPPAAEPATPPAAPGALRSSLGPDTTINGKLSFVAPTRIDGKLKGEVRAAELLVVGEQARVEGAVRAPRLVVNGEVHGEVLEAEHVEIGPTGRVSGRVESQGLVVCEGARLDADCRIAPRPRRERAEDPAAAHVPENAGTHSPLFPPATPPSR